MAKKEEEEDKDGEEDLFVYVDELKAFEKDEQARNSSYDVIVFFFLSFLSIMFSD